MTRNTQLKLEVDKLQVYLANQGDDVVIAMPNGRSLQLLTMNIEDSSGNKLAIKNRGEIMKFDNTIYASDFVVLAAGARIKIGEATLQSDSLDLDLFTVDLVSGTYQLKFIYSNRKNQYYNEEEKRLIRLDNVWSGKIESAEQLISVP